MLPNQELCMWDYNTRFSSRHGLKPKKFEFSGWKNMYKMCTSLLPYFPGRVVIMKINAQHGALSKAIKNDLK